jgi:hypothetical protein
MVRRKRARRHPLGETKTLSSHFVHRRNPDGSYDSICLNCYLTIETQHEESDLSKAEKEHDCEDFLRQRETAYQGPKSVDDVLCLFAYALFHVPRTGTHQELRGPMQGMRREHPGPG